MRVGSYMVGLLLGLLLHKTKDKFKSRGAMGSVSEGLFSWATFNTCPFTAAYVLALVHHNGRAVGSALHTVQFRQDRQVRRGSSHK